MLKKKWKTGKQVLASCYVALAFLMAGISPAVANAADFGTVFTKVGNIANQAGPAIKIVFFVCGLILLGTGVFKWLQASKRDEPKGPAISCVVGGFVLLGIWGFAQMGAESLGLNVEASW